MRERHRHVLFVAVVGAALTVASIGAQHEAPSNDYPNPYTIETWGHLPAGRMFGGIAGVDVDIDGKSLWVFERCGAASCVGSPVAPLLKFDANGLLVASFGAGMFVYPHGVHVDRQGNVWVTDGRGEQGKGHQVVKFSPTGKVLMTLGKAGVAGNGPDTFNMPSDVLVAPNGSIFVADGHGGDSNARIVKFDKDGHYLKEWGKKGSGPGEFDTPHGLLLDARGRLIVADRGNSRIQVFDQEGRYITEWHQFGRPSGIALDTKGVLYVADSQSNTSKVNPTVKRGVRIGPLAEARVQFFVPEPDPLIETETGGREGVAVDRDGVVYVTRTGNGALFRYTRK